MVRIQTQEIIYRKHILNKKLLTILIISMFTLAPAKADFAFSEASDYTGDAFFIPSKQLGVTENETSVKKSSGDSHHTTPPIKQLRLYLKNKIDKHNNQVYELAPTAKDVYSGEIETSEYASHELIENFDDDAISEEIENSTDSFDSEDSNVEDSTKKHFWSRKNKTDKKQKIKKASKKDAVAKNEPISEDSDDIILSCNRVDYDTQNYLIFAKGNVSVEFVSQGTTVYADIITFDRANNTIKAEGNVKISKGSQIVNGDYIFVDMNEENALIENPVTRTSNILIKSEKGYVYGDKISQEKGTITIDDSFPIEFRSLTRGPQLKYMLTPKGETLTDDMNKGVIKVTSKDIKITQNGDLETIALKRFRMKKGDKTLLRIPSVKLYTNKNHDYVESNIWEIGAYRGLGVYTGPGIVLELPKGSVLKAMPILNYKSGFGIGGLGRFNSGTNQTSIAYGTAASKFIIDGEQKLDDNLTLQYGMNNFQNEWFLGRRRPKYGIGLVYKKDYFSDNFLIKGQRSTFSHRVEGGYYQDLDFDTSFEKLKGNNIGTTRFRYMANAAQTLFNYVDEDKLKAISFAVSSQFSSALYGTGDTQVIGRIGPVLHTQYKRWMQDVGYYFSAYHDETPMPVFDSYRYGKQNLFFREYFRISKYLTVSWFSSINMSNDAPNDRDLQENAFYISVGPDDMKMSFGYDFVRQNLYCVIELMMDAKGAQVEYDHFEIQQKKKAENKKTATESGYESATAPKILQKAVVEEVKTVEDVL